MKNLVEQHTTDCGGIDNISSSELALIRRCAVLIAECERREVGFAAAGQVDDEALAIYQTVVNTLRRTLESLGLQRRARDIGPTLGQLIREDQEAERERLAAERSRPTSEAAE